MSEAGTDISAQKAKLITEDMIRDSEKVVNMGCMDKSECRLLFLNNPVDWGIKDPKGKPIENVREIRDQIKRRVLELVAGLKESGQ